MPGLDINWFVGLNESLAIHLKCGICADIFNKPVDTQCRHTFCEDCIKQWSQSNNHKECPICRQQLNDSDLNTNRLINEIINDLKVKCDSKNCKTIVPFGCLKKHMTECQYRTCDKCGFLMGNILQHNCLQLTKLELGSKQENILKLEEENKALKAQIEKNIQEKNAEIQALGSKIDKLNREITQLKVPLGQMIGKRSCYVSQDIDPKKVHIFETIDINLFKFIKIDNSFIRIELNKAIPVTISDKYTSIFFCIKNSAHFLSLKGAIKSKIGSHEQPELKMSTGYLIKDLDTPLSLNMSNDVKLFFYFPSDCYKGYPINTIALLSSTVS